MEVIFVILNKKFETFDRQFKIRSYQLHAHCAFHFYRRHFDEFVFDSREGLLLFLNDFICHGFVFFMDLSDFITNEMTQHLLRRSFNHFSVNALMCFS